MKVGLIVTGDLELQPYLFYYTDVLDSLNMEYDYICMNRDTINKTIYNNHKVIAFGSKRTIKRSNVLKVLDYYLFSRAVMNYLGNNKIYSCLIVFTIPGALFLKKFLQKQFNNRYVFDIRDYSLLYRFFSSSVANLIFNSLFTSISSEGFLKWLPKSNNYVISHNCNKRLLLNSGEQNVGISSDKIIVLTIGRIRDYSITKRFIEALGDRKDISIVICGTGYVKDHLQKIFKTKYANLNFIGQYNKDDELSIVRRSSLINIILPNNILSNSLLSNRFYNGIIGRRPLIVNQESYHARFVYDYNLGIVMKSNDNLYDEIVKYVLNFDSQLFNNGCDELIKLIINDINKFEFRLVSSLNSIIIE